MTQRCENGRINQSEYVWSKCDILYIFKEALKSKHVYLKLTKSVQTHTLSMKVHTSTCPCFSEVETSCNHPPTVFPCFPHLDAGLPSHPQHEVMKRQCTGCPGMITFYIKGKLEHATAFLSTLKVIWQFLFALDCFVLCFCKCCEAGGSFAK